VRRLHVGRCPFHIDIKIITHGGTGVDVPGHSVRPRRRWPATRSPHGTRLSCDFMEIPALVRVSPVVGRPASGREDNGTCGLSTALRARPRVRLVRPGQEARAEALLVLATELDEEKLALMGGACGARGRPRIVLVARYAGRAPLVRAVRHGVVDVLPRRTGLDQIVLAPPRTRRERLRRSGSALADGLELRQRARAVEGAAPCRMP
jgi:hypothetical protein